MKIALCFIISYNHFINKEKLWIDWIEYNKDIINIYFHYKDIKKIKSSWILQHIIPQQNIMETSYFHMVPAYMSLLNYAYNHDVQNKWFCLLTESCVPIISPSKFRNLFYENIEKSIFKWKNAWWNVNFHRRANLRYLNKDMHLGNEPWFILSRDDLYFCMYFYTKNTKLVHLVCSGGLANESIFAIMLKYTGRLNGVINEINTATDWTRISSPTSPHLFKYGNKTDIGFILKFLKDNKYTCFLRKVDPLFPNEILHNIIYK